jgi:type I restriction enzyme S subunit
MATNQGFKSLVPDQSRVDPEFLAHWLAANTNYLQSLGNGATFKEISKSVVAKVLIALPPLDEQRRIARVLDEVDRVRALRSRAQNGIKDLERAVFARAIRECAPGRKIPVGEAAEVLSGFPFSSAEFTDAGVRLCRGANVLPGKLDWSDLRCWASMDDPQLRRYVLGTDDIVVAMDRPWISSGFKIARVAPHDLPALLVQRVARLRADPMTLDQRLLFAALDSAEFQRHCRPTETTIPHISPKEIRSFALAVPSLAEQRRVAAALRRIDGIASREVEQLSRLDALFATLQRRAFSGEL